MKQEEIDRLLNSYFISQEDLESRVVLKEFCLSISDILIDDFVKDYLVDNPYLNIYLAHTDGSMLVKKMKIFISNLLVDPIDELYVNRIQEIGVIHYSIKLDTAKVSYGFWAMNQVLNKMSEVNQLVKENQALISKLLRFVEHVMNDSYRTIQNSKNPLLSSTSSNFNPQNELYIGFNTHKLNLEKIQDAIKVDSTEVISSIKEEPKECSFGKVIAALRSDSRYEFILGLNSKLVEDIHERWHQEFVKIKQAIESSNQKDIGIYNSNLQNLTDELKEILDASLKESLEDGQLALNSGIRAMKKMTENFYLKNYKENSNEKIENSINDTIQNVISSELDWAIESIKISNTEKLEQKEFDVYKVIRYNGTNIYIGVKLKVNQNSQYLQDMTLLLLEVLDLHLSVQERELSLISFADKAESANKSKDMFLANMSHELRTPLNAITGFSQILMMKKDTPDKVKKYIEKINIAGNSLLELVNTILDFAKLEAGKMQFSPSLSNISNVLHEVETLVSTLADKKSITLKMPNIISLNLFIDKMLFKQVLVNLLTNAIKFTHEGGDVSLNIEFDPASRLYKFEVKDNGVGLSPTAINSLFQAFSQVNNIYQKEQKGTGLGLMISKKIVEELHKGKIWVESVEGEGSSFFITMPTPTIESHTHSVIEAPEDAPNVLIVEDSEDYQKILIEHLKKSHNLTLTDTINKAKDLLSKESYDFIILDFFLTDGISSEILLFMEEENISTPVIVISAEDEIHISTSLSGFSNLHVILNKKNINEICASLRGEAYQSETNQQ